MFRNIALLGAARSGKDTVAGHLANEYGYVRLAFATPLKDAAMLADPLIPTEMGSEGRIHVRLTSLVRDYGWDEAKTRYPEVRRFLQTYGTGVRLIDQDFWLRQLLKKVIFYNVFGLPVVVTDVRYRNEADALKRGGFTLVRIDRPSAEADGGEFRQHASETEVSNYGVHHTITNDGSLAYLFKQVDTLTA